MNKVESPIKDDKNDSSKRDLKSQQAKSKPPFDTQFNAPSISLPKGGGALKGIDEKFQVNPSNGTSSFNIPVPFSHGRHNFTPSVSVSYNSGVGNSILGLGWSLENSSIQRKTDKLLPKYDDDEDTFLFSGSEDLVPFLNWDATGWTTEEKEANSYKVKRYRPRIEGLFARIEKISHPVQGTYWRVTTRDNITTFFGYSPSARIIDPDSAQRIFQWLPEISFDDRGNCIVYEYKKENLDDVAAELHEKNRLSGTAAFTNLYLKRIRYGNRSPYIVDKLDPYNVQAIPARFLFDAVFDYGEHDEEKPQPEENVGLSWKKRVDAFSSYKSGFEIRTYRLLKRILMFHTFDELESGSPCLVRSLDFSYQSSSLNSPQQSEVTYLKSIAQRGYILKPDGTYSKKALPAAEFDYELLNWNNQIEEVDQDSITNLPVGLSQNYLWLDFYGEGISGIFSEQAEGWFYKSNLGDVDEDDRVQLGRMAKVVPKPSFSGMSSGTLQLQDLEATGQKQIVVNASGLSGFFELTDENDWLPFRPFLNSPNVNFRDPNLRMIDLNGDGQADLLITEDNVFTWYPSKGKTGYEPARHMERLADEENGPVLVFSEPLQSIFLSDMTGDGLTDIVRIRNAEICYWPNLGYGKFGAKITMSNAPVFDSPDQFNPAYINLADISGTGATDLLYLGKNKCSAYLNLSGNSWSDEQEITPFFNTEQPNKVAVVDLLGNSTSCIVWSSELPGNETIPMRYIDLMGGKKPHLLTTYKNNTGLETNLFYKSSTWFYLKDKTENKPWITKLPFPVHCVRKVEKIDRITNTKFTTQYRFHHGYYDHSEREFRGFGMVEQIDTEQYENWTKSNANNILDRTLYQDPILTKTWFHTGAFLDREKILTQFSSGYWYNEMARQGFAVTADEPTLDDASVIAAPVLDPNAIQQLTPEEWRETLRACKGMVLRKEVFALDAPTMGATPLQLQTQLSPYSVSTHNCVIELLQGRGFAKYAVFIVKESEAVTYHYERNLEDPRISHELNIKIDDLGNILESASVVYARKLRDPSLPNDIQDIQSKSLVTYTKNDYTNDIQDPVEYRLRVTSETKTYEIKGAKKTGTFYKVSDFKDVLTSSVEIQYRQLDVTPVAGATSRRLIEHIRTIFYRNDLTGPLPLNSLESLALPFEAYKLAFTPDLLNDIFGAKATNAIMLEGKYVNSGGDQNWWIRSGSIQYIAAGESSADARNRFFMPISYTDPFGAITRVGYFSSYFIFIQQTLDAISNLSRVETFNLRSLSPERMKDPNDNLSAVLVDELGLVKAFAVLGKGNEADDLLSLTDYTTAAEKTIIDDFLSANDSTDLTILGKDLLKRASARFVYDFDRYKNSGGKFPIVAASIVREQHQQQNNDSPIQLSFEYSNGFGQIVMKKVQAEPGKAKRVTVQPDNSYAVQQTDTSTLNPKQLRWLGSGRIVLNNKGNAIKQFEPYFSITHRYEDQKELVETGVTPILYYDPMDRLIKTEFPDGTFAKTNFNSWKQTVYDQNDTLLDSSWYNNRFNRLIDAELITAGKNPSKEQEAATKTASHANTPSVQHFDTLGRSILTIDNNGKDSLNQDILIYTRTDIDIEGNQRSITDARNNVVMQHKFDMLGTKVYQLSMDAGERWMLLNVFGNPLRTWDSRNHEFSFNYDALHRPIIKKVSGGDGTVPLNNVVERIIYGEGLPNDKGLNLRTRIAVVYDTAGKLQSAEFDFKGNLLRSVRRFAIDYKKVIDWSGANLDSKLENEQFITITSFDALNRVLQQTLPDSSDFLPQYNEAGLLDKVQVTQNGNTQDFVNNIDYNEKGQRNRILYGNAVSTNYFYDSETFRLLRLETKQANIPLQDCHYTYDPVGNITHIEDKNIPTIFFNNQKIAGTGEYSYDPLYRLTEAKGREHTGAIAFGAQDNWNDLPFLKQYSQNDPMVWRNYTQQYRYDFVGNIQQMRHIAQNGNWTRDYDYNTNNNRLSSTAVGTNTYNYTHHPQHGFMQSMPHLQVMEWNFRDELQAVAKQAVVAGTPETTYYVYDGSGQRARKITEKQAGAGAIPGKKSERIYSSGIEVYREFGMGVDFERFTLHVMDDKRRIAMIETLTIGNDGSPSKLVRYQFSNHLGSACIEADQTGRVISYEEYHPYGTTSYQAVDKDIKAAQKRYRFTGMERDEESGLEYHSARYYAVWLGRWISCDPLYLSDGLNVYRYCKDNPTISIDTKGSQSDQPETVSTYKPQFQNLMPLKINLSVTSDAVRASLLGKVRVLEGEHHVVRTSPFDQPNVYKGGLTLNEASLRFSLKNYSLAFSARGSLEENLTGIRSWPSDFEASGRITPHFSSKGDSIDSFKLSGSASTTFLSATFAADYKLKTSIPNLSAYAAAGINILGNLGDTKRILSEIKGLAAGDLSFKSTLRLLGVPITHVWGEITESTKINAVGLVTIPAGALFDVTTPLVGGYTSRSGAGTNYTLMGGILPLISPEAISRGDIPARMFPTYGYARGELNLPNLSIRGFKLENLRLGAEGSVSISELSKPATRESSQTDLIQQVHGKGDEERGSGVRLYLKGSW